MMELLETITAYLAFSLVIVTVLSILRIYRVLGHVYWLLFMAAFLGLGVSTVRSFEAFFPSLGLLRPLNSVAPAFIAGVLFVLAIRKLSDSVMDSTTAAVPKKLMSLKGDVQTLRAHLSLTNGLITRMVLAIGAAGVRDVLSQCAEEHPILMEDHRPTAGGMLDEDFMIKNLARIHETEKVQEISSTFSDLNERLIDLYAALTSPARAAEVVAEEVEAEQGEGALWVAGVPLGKYNEIVYEKRILLGLPEGVADDSKASAYVYVLFKRILEPLLIKCGPVTIRKMQRTFEELTEDKSSIGLIRLAADGRIDLSELYEQLSSMKIDVGMQETVDIFSTVINAFYPLIKEDMGAKQTNEMASGLFSSLLRKHGSFLQRYGITESIPDGVEIPSTYRPLVSGKSYLVEGRDPAQAFKMFADIVRLGSLGLFISTAHPADVKKEHGIPNHTTVLWLSKVEAENAVSPSNLGILRDSISSFVSRNKNAVVMLEGLEYLITTNGFDFTLKFTHDIREAAVVNRAKLIVPISPGALEPRQLELLRRYMNIIEVDEAKSSGGAEI